MLIFARFLLHCQCVTSDLTAVCTYSMLIGACARVRLPHILLLFQTGLLPSSLNIYRLFRIEKKRAAIPVQITAQRRPHASATIRGMTADDVDGVMAIEVSSFDKPYERDYFLKALKKPRVNVVIAVCDDAPVAAYAAFFVSSSRRCVRSLSF